MSNTNTQVIIHLLSANIQKQDQSADHSQNKEAEKLNQNPSDKPQMQNQPKKNIQQYIGLPNQGTYRFISYSQNNRSNMLYEQFITDSFYDS